MGQFILSKTCEHNFHRLIILHSTNQRGERITLKLKKKLFEGRQEVSSLHASNENST